MNSTQLYGIIYLSAFFWGNLNVAEDGTIYFLTMYGTVYQVSADGGTPTVFIEGVTTPYQQGVNEFMIADGWLYYNFENTSGIGNRASVIKRMRLDGTDDQILMGEDDDHIYWLLDVTDDYIYYIDGAHGEESSSNGRAALDGSQQEHIDFIPYSSDVQNVDGWLYYCNESTISRIRPDGTEQQVIYDEGYCSQYNATGDWIYCLVTDVEGDTDNRYMIRMKMDGSDIQVLNNEGFMNFSVAGDVMATMQDGMIGILDDSGEASLVKSTADN